MKTLQTEKLHENSLPHRNRNNKIKKKPKIIIKTEILSPNDTLLKSFHKKNYMSCFVVCVPALFFTRMFNDLFLNVRPQCHHLRTGTIHMAFVILGKCSTHCTIRMRHP